MKINIHIKDASKILLVNSILSVDKGNMILTEEKIRESNSKLEGEEIGTPIQAEVKRAEFLINETRKVVPWLSKVSQISTDFSWKSTIVLVIIMGLLTGTGFQFFENRDTFHVLSISLITIILWNFIRIFLIPIYPIFIKILLSIIKKEEKDRGNYNKKTTLFLLYSELVEKIRIRFHRSTSMNPDLKQQEIAGKSWIEFVSKWNKLIGKVVKYERQKMSHLFWIIHTSSAIIAAFINGITKSYQATIESTFITPSQIMSAIDFIFIPSKMIIGKLPHIRGIDATGIIGTAKPWIYHYMVTLILFVLIPRLILFFWTIVKGYYLKSNFPIPKEFIFKDTLNIALASHTNIGKTSLLRTLVKRDVGTVGNKENVTQKSSGYFMLNEQDARLRIWDTPGFSDVDNLINCVKKYSLDIFLKKYRKKSKLNVDALLALKNESDLILFLVPANSDRRLENTINRELILLKKLNKPILCSVNRLDRENNKKKEDSLNRWKEFFQKHHIPGEYVLSLDAHYRTMEEEALFFEKITQVLNFDAKKLAEKIHKYHKEKRENQFNKLGEIISSALIELCKVYSMGEKKSDGKPIEQLKKSSNKLIFEVTGEIINIIGLDHEIDEAILEKIKKEIKEVNLGQTDTFVGAVKDGALAGVSLGVATTLLDGGFGMLGGVVIGAITGGIGSFIVRYSYREIIYEGEKIIIWDEKFIREVLYRLIWNYLAFSFYGRARGKITNEDVAETEKLPDLLEEAAKLTLNNHWETLWETLRLFQKKNDKNTLIKIIDKINPLVKNKIADKKTVVDRCKGILEESNRNWIRLRNLQDYKKRGSWS